MSISVYDEAITQKIKNWVKNTKAVVFGPNESERAFSILADINDDAPASLPIVTISRNPSVEIQQTNKRPMSWAGKVFYGSKDKNGGNNYTAGHLNAIPIRIQYSLDIYTRLLSEADEYISEFTFDLINYPSVVIEIDDNQVEEDYGKKLRYTSFLTIDSTLNDNSDIDMRVMPGQFSHWTINFSLNDAYLFQYDRRNVPKIIDMDIEAI